MTFKCNDEFLQLCRLATKLFPNGTRADAFEAACQERPDLAAVAIDRSGQPVVWRSKISPAPLAAAQPKAEPLSDADLIRQFCRAARCPERAEEFISVGRTPASVGAELLGGAGLAKPWREVFKDLDIQTKESK